MDDKNKVVKGDTDATIAFAKWFFKDQDIVIQTIHPENRTIRAYTFKHSEIKDFRATVDAAQGQSNVYFQVNPLKTAIRGSAKATKDDVASVTWLQVDMDPRPREDFDVARERILGALQKFKPHPNLIIDSGGGYQAFWRLEQPILIEPRDDGSEPWAEAEAYSQQLAVILTADNCFNCDRIMRLPGTVNVPDAKKRAKGRVPRLASVVYQDDKSYPLSAFTKAPVVRISGDAGGSVTGPVREVKLSGNIERLTVEELKELARGRSKELTDFTAMMIVQGNDPDNPNKYKSRSEATFRVLIDLVKADFTADEIAAVITDPDYGISAHVLSQKRPVKYAARQIRRAQEAVINPHLVEMNERYAVIHNYGGKHVVITEDYDEALKRTVIKHQNKDNFLSANAHRKVEVGRDKDGNPEMMPLGKWWLFHPNARRYDFIVFAPGKEAEIIIPKEAPAMPITKLNLWQGFACEAIPGDCSLYLNHLRDNICSGNDEHFEYLINWMARGVQLPNAPGEVAFIMRGARGAGKSLMAKTYGSLFGRHFIQISNSNHLVGNFNAHLRDCIVIFADEAFYAGDKKHESVLKTLVTEETIVVEPKGVDAEQAPNYTRMIMSSNDAWVVPAGSDERRYFVVDVSKKNAKNIEYFKKIVDQMNNGGREALLHFLLHRDISNFEVRRAPDSKALQDQKFLSMKFEEQWWLEKLTDGRVFNTSEKWTEEINKDALYEDYLSKANNVRTYRPMSSMSFSRWFAKFAGEPDSIKSFQKWVKKIGMSEDGDMVKQPTREYFWKIPTLVKCREYFDTSFGQQEWPLVEDQTEAPF